ncbi:hypothetical protein CBS147320_1753 [Aspergillus niger]|nr:hypothetical protein CBS147320_1753 [Aspergillus niger]
MSPNRRNYSHMRDAALNIRADSDDEYEHSDMAASGDEALQILMEANYNDGASYDQSSTDEFANDDGDHLWQVQADLLSSRDESGCTDEREHTSWQSQSTDPDTQCQQFDYPPPPPPPPPQLQHPTRYSLEKRKPKTATEDKPDDIISYCNIVVDMSNMKTALRNVKDYLDKGQTREAEVEAQKARDLAEKYGERPVIARCRYWQARVKFAQGNYEKAYRLFRKCQLWITKQPEARTMAFYLPLCQPGLSDQDRQRMLQDAHRPAMQLQKIPTVSEVPDNRDSKRRWNDSLHLLSQDNIPQSTHRQNVARPKSLLERQPEDSSGLKLGGKQKLFTFEMHPKGMAPRFRPTDIFAEQPYEVIVPQEQWEDFIDYHRDQSVTLSYLERERRRYQTVVQERYNQR